MKQADPFMGTHVMGMVGIDIRRAPSHLLLSALALISAGGGRRLHYCLAQDFCGNATPLRVENLADARALGAAVNCTDGGKVEVVWAGAVTLDAPISIGMGTNLSISGEGSLAEVHGDSLVRLFDVAPGAGLELTNLTLSEGSAASSGAIHSSNATLTLDSCVFAGNAATNGDGGAVGAQGGTLTIVGGTFVNNEATGNGGAVLAMDAGLVVRKGTVFEGNRAAVEGGALFCGAAETTKTVRCTLSQAVFTSNSASGDADISVHDISAWLGFFGGGAAAFSRTDVDITDSVFELNHATVSGGAVFGGSGSEMTVNGSTFHNNTTPGCGAAIAASSATLGGDTLVTYNYADEGGGGVSVMCIVCFPGRARGVPPLMVYRSDTLHYSQEHRTGLTDSWFAANSYFFVEPL